MEHAEQFSTLVAGIYDAALDATLWPEALDRTAHFVGGRAAALYSKDAMQKHGEFCYDNGCIDSHYRRLYSEKYVEFDPTALGHVFAEVEEPMATEDLIPYGEFVETRFYQEWARPQDLAYGVSTVLDKTATGAALFGVFRHERDGIVDADMRRRMRLVAPHIRRATMVGRAIDLGKAKAETLADALDGISAGMFLVDAGGRILHANAAGLRIIAPGGALRMVGGRLAANDGEAEEQLRRAFAASGAGDDGVGDKGVSVPLTTRSGEPHVAHVLPLTAGDRRRAGATYAATCALFVRKAVLDAPSPPGVIAQTYRLTPTELRVLLAIVDVGGAPEVAEALGIAESTVKTHLSRLYGKTGAGRQADLVKLVAGFASPLLN